MRYGGGQGFKIEFENEQDMASAFERLKGIATPQPAAHRAEPTAQWGDPRVQIVYDLLVSCDTPPVEQHWEGWTSRRIVDAIAAQAEPAAQSAVADEQIKPLINAVWGANLAHPDIERRLRFAREVLALASSAQAGEQKP